MFAAPCQENCVTLGVGEQTAGISGMVVERKKRKRKRPCTVLCVCALRAAPPWDARRACASYAKYEL